MAVNFFEKQKRKQKYMVFIALAMVLITAAIIWYGFFRGEKDIKTPAAASVFAQKEIKINFDFLDGPALDEMAPFISAVPFVGKVGRENPFVSY